MSVVDCQIDTAIRHLYDTVIDPGNWEVAIDAVAEVTGGLNASIVTVCRSATLDHVGQKSMLVAVSRQLRENMDEVEAYCQKFEKYQNIELEKIQNTKPLEILDDSFLWPELESPHTREDFHYRVEKFGVHQRWFIRLNDDEHHFHYLLLQFGKDLLPLDDVVRRKVCRLITHVSQVVEMGRLFKHLKLQSDSVLGALDMIKVGLCLVHEDGTIFQSNKAALDIISKNPLFDLSSGQRLIFNSRKVGRSLAEAISAVCRAKDGIGKSVEFRFVGCKGGGSNKILMEISSLGASAHEISSVKDHALIMLIDPAQDHSAVVDRIGLIYALSPSEMAVIHLVLKGLTNQKIADFRGVSIETIKTQIRSISHKTMARSRSELVSLLLRLSPPIGAS